MDEIKEIIIKEDNPIDVDTWSQKELLKHLYRVTMELKKDMKSLHDKLDSQKTDYETKLQHLNDKFEGRVRALEDYKTTQLGMWKFITAISTTVSIVSILLSLYSYLN